MAKQQRWTEEEIRYLKKWYGKKLAKDIEKELGRKNVIQKAYHLGLVSGISKGAYKLLAKLKQSNVKMVGEYLGSNIKTDFKCPFCGKIFQTTPRHVASKHTKSCGCVSIGKRKGSKHISHTYFRVVVVGAKARGHDCKIDIQYLDDMLVKQDFKCALSNVAIVAGYIDLRKHTASLDRIDSSKGYIKGNVQWVHKDVNLMKQGYSQEYFIDMCRRITDEI